jgi:2-C-methyl-D-erythritol 4-phosphate cytidylyltransferase
VPKQFLPLGGKPLWEHAACVLGAAPLVDAVVVAVPPGWEDRVRETAARAGLAGKLHAVVPGGATRQESVERALEAAGGFADVLVHDAARPCISARLVRDVVAAARRSGAATAALQVTDTLLREVGAAPGRLEAVPRDGLWAVQTPQAFDRELLRRAHGAARSRGIEATDDGRLVLELGAALVLVPGSWWNVKVTLPEDLQRAARILSLGIAALEAP